jgi:hypothetical protein
MGINEKTGMLGTVGILKTLYIDSRKKVLILFLGKKNV